MKRFDFSVIFQSSLPIVVLLAGLGGALYFKEAFEFAFPAVISLLILLLFWVIRTQSRRADRLVAFKTRELKETNERFFIQYAVTRILSESEDFAESIRKILELVCTQCHWDCAAFWGFDSSGKLRCQQFWEKTGSSFKDFKEATMACAFDIGEGTPGRVWKQAAPVWFPRIDLDESYLRRDVASRYGIVNVMGFPVLLQGSVMAVLEFNSISPVEVNESLKQMFEGLGAQIGQFMLKRKTESLLKWSDERRKKSEERFRRVVEACPSGIIMANADGEIVLVNDEIRKVFGYEGDELIGVPVETLIPEPQRSTHRGHREIFHEKPERRSMGQRRNLTGIRKDTTEFPIEVVLSPVETEEGMMILAAVEDITERQKIEQMKNDFVSTVSHELRTPLTAIRGSLGLLEGGVAGELPDKSRMLVKMAVTNCDRLVRLVGDILDIDKIESGKLRFEMQPLDLMTLIDHVVEVNRPFANEYGVKLNYRDRLERMMVEGDHDRLNQVFTNLISNAVKFSPREEVVTVRACLVRGSVRIEITDHGPGIPEEFQSRIFQRFAQANSSNTRQSGSSGLGLAISKAIVESHGGHVGYSTKIEKGSTFYVDLPMTKGNVCGLLPPPRSGMTKGSPNGEVK